MKIIDKEDCMGCHACFNICPTGAISMIENEKGFKTYKIDKEKCIKCNRCRKVCPVLSKESINNTPKAYACINENEEIKIKSSSGGVFSLLAECILNKNGVVFGAGFDNNWNVKHSYVEKIEDIEKFRGSKYVQSTIGDSYKKAKEFLEIGRYVLFSGTPCQIEGLKAFLGKEYDNLYTQDIICHGVPSPKVWRKYLEFRERKDKNKPNGIYFRNKDNGWTTFSMKFDYNKTEYKEVNNKDLFMEAFLRNTVLRDSCYNCHFKKKHRISDITLADFWGIDNIVPEMNDNSGASLVIINSEKGDKLFKEIKEKMRIKQVDFEEAIRYNPSMTKSCNMDTKRENFFENLEKMSFDKLVNKYTTKPSTFKILMNRTKAILKKILANSN